MKFQEYLVGAPIRFLDFNQNSWRSFL